MVRPSTDDCGLRKPGRRGRLWFRVACAVGLMLLGLFLARPPRPGGTAPVPEGTPAPRGTAAASAASDQPDAMPDGSLRRVPADESALDGRESQQPPPPKSPAPAAFRITGPQPDGDGRTRVEFRLGEYRLADARAVGERYTAVWHAGAGRLNVRGAPDLPCFRANLALDVAAAPEASVIEAEYDDVACAPPLPSAGFVSRDGDLEDDLPPPGPAYFANIPFPAVPARLTAPFQLRSVRGVGLIVQPFQYRPREGTLRVFRRMVVEVSGTVGDEALAAGLARLPRDYAWLAAARFAAGREDTGAGGAVEAGAVTAASSRTAGTFRPDGSVLVVVPDAMATHVDGFVEWKRQLGWAVEVARYPSDTGAGKDGLAATIAGRYASDNLAYVILVGDSADLPVMQTSPNPTDTRYALLAGDDLYHDLLISRIPASNPTQIANQLGKLVAYEKTPAAPGADVWYSKALFVGSNEGASKSPFYLADWQHLNLERDKLLADGYTQVDQVYDPGATVSEVTTAWNAGRNLVYYLGHGTETAWNTTGFSVAQATALTNGSALPFVVNGNCKNGNFTRTTGDCLAEAMLKTGTAGLPAGAIAVIAATTSMDWNPPIVMMRTFTEEWVAGAPATAGAMAFLAIQEATDYCLDNPATEGASAATKLVEQTHLLGDCTLSLRTRTPKPIRVDRPPYAIAGEAFVVHVSDLSGTPVAGARACLYRAGDVQIVAETDGSGAAALDTSTVPAAPGEALTLTVSGRNLVPVQEQVPALPGELTIYSAAALPTAFTGEHYTFQHAAAGGALPFAWAITAGQPPWLELDPQTGQVSGTPEAAGTFTYTVQVTDFEGAVATQEVTLTAGDAVAVPAVALPAGEVNATYEAALAATGSFPPFSFVILSGSLPPGLTLGGNGALRGVPTAAGQFAFQVKATDSQSRTATRTLAIDIAPAAVVTIAAAPVPPDGERGQSYGFTFTASGGTGTGFTWEVVGGALPPGLTLTPTGTLAGIAQEDGVFTFALRVQDDGEPPHTAQKEFHITVVSAVYFTATALPFARVGAAYDAVVPVAGSYTPFTYTATFPDGYETLTAANSFTAGGVRQAAWIADEQEWELALGFDFPFYGAAYPSCRVGDNGYLIFGNGSPFPKWDANATQLSAYRMVAPFWNDLVISTQYPDTGIFLDKQPDAVTVRWRGRDFHTPEYIVNVAATLFRNGRIVFSYGELQTTNRTVIGLGGGAGNAAEVIYTHAWSPGSPDLVTEWSYHADQIFTLPQSIPEWLTVSADGHLTGQPTVAGTFTFTLQVTDAAGHTALGELTLTAADQLPGDTNDDGDVDNGEILALIEAWRDGTVTTAWVDEAVAHWRLGPPPGARQGGGLTRGTLPSPAARTGEVLVLDVPCPRAAATELARLGFDVAGYAGGVAQVYATPAEAETLAALGYIATASARQFVVPGDREAARVPAGYRDYAALSSRLAELAAAHPEVCRLITIGKSVQDRDIWAVKLTDQPDAAEPEPEVKILAAIHGDEPVAAELAMRLIEHLLENYGAPTPAGALATERLDSLELWIVPLVNPDGYEAQTRYNANGTDLNRNFPDGATQPLGTYFPGGVLDVTGRQPETAAVMAWSAGRNFTLAASLHSGAVVVAYPYGNNAAGQAVNTPTPDDALYRHLATLYASLNPTMAASAEFPGGITNAADWYLATGEMADWNYRYLGTVDLTVELSNVKAPAAAGLDALWEANRDALLTYIGGATIGVSGGVAEAGTGAPLWARITVDGNAQPAFSSPDLGDFHRLLLPGTYSVGAECDGFLPVTEAAVAVAAGAATAMDFALPRGGHQVTRATTPATYLPGGSGTVSLDINLDESAMPAGFIVTEELPAGWRYVAGSTQAEDRTALPDPRLDGQRVSWLLWGDDAADTVFSYEVSIPGDDAATVALTGQLETTAGLDPIAGVVQWPVRARQSHEYSLVAGWNLLSVPFLPDAPAVADFFEGLPAVPTVLAWDGAAYAAATALEPGHGYWVFTEAGGRVAVSGYEEAVRERTLRPGWSLVGPLADVALPAVAELVPPAWGWDGQYRASQRLLAGAGWWVYCLEACDLPLSP
ncbi:MAG: Gingipain R2 precursor [Lentisphaerae bacterium ADurb.BinA184]|nr:MAG: Gingipain R2 precursor [Lentisphaerae bacterium ADurb.BinA184]